MHPETQDYPSQVIETTHAYDGNPTQQHFSRVGMTTLTQPVDAYAMSAQTSQQGDTYSMHSSPSPSPPSGPHPGAGRQRSKSGTNHLTMQQLNKKRQRATPEQLSVLEESFLINPSPNAKMRELIAERIRMTERSVQIWFQNRYDFCLVGLMVVAPRSSRCNARRGRERDQCICILRIRARLE